MDLYRRYLAGEEIDVWNDIHNLDLNSPITNMEEVLLVVKETMSRVKFNIECIYSYLQENKYNFRDRPSLSIESELDIIKLKKEIKEFGTIPLSLEYFYKIVGAVNLCQSLSTPLLYKYSDPLYIESIEGVLGLIKDGGWEEDMEEIEEGEFFYINISPDLYHKDNVSGGSPYAIEISKDQKIDTHILNTKYGNLYFIDYLRLCFNWAGFPNFEEYNIHQNKFLDTIRNKLKNI